MVVDKSTTFSVIKSIAVLIIFSVAMLSGGDIYADWIAPIAAPPLDNVAAPLNENTPFGGNGTVNLVNSDIIGKFNHLQISIPSCLNGQVLMWSTTSPSLATGQVVCRNPFSGGYWQLNGTNLYPSSLNYQIGIGTATPNRALHVASSTGNAEIDISSGNNDLWAMYQDNNTGDFRFWNTNVPSEGNSLTLTKGGNIGIGTSTPQAKLEVKGQAMFGGGLEILGIGKNLLYGNVSGSAVGGNLFLLQKGGQNRFVIDLSGNATSSGNFSAPQLCIGTDCRIAWPAGTGGGGIDNFWATSTNPNNIYNKNTGNVGIGTATPAAGVKLDVNGGIKIAASISGETAGTISYSDSNFWGFNGSIWRSLAVGSYVGVTPSAYDGNQSGYKSADLICRNTVLANSHVCSVEEIFNSIRLNVSIPAVNAWINNGAPGSNSNTGNDCIGWTSNQPTDIAVFWRFNASGGSALLTACNQSLVFACCK